MKDLTQGLEYTSQIFRRETARKGWYRGFCEKNTASNYKARFEKNELSDDKIEKILDFLGYEMVQKPIEAAWRKKEERKYSIWEDGEHLGIYTAKTSEEASKLAAIEKYGETETHTDFKGRTKFLWELSLCDFRSEEIE